MANLTETPTYEAGIYRFETTDPVQGGPGGIDNLPTNQLANRTAWLKAQVEAILLDIAAIESGYATAASLAAHAGNTSNPHAVTKSQVGLGSVLNYGIATQAEAEAGASDSKYLTPLRAKQAIAALVPAATETVAGLIERATAAEAQGLVDTLRAITPSTLAAAFGGANQLRGSNGFQKIPGGLILQWANGQIEANAGETLVTFPVAFPVNAVAYAIGTSATSAFMSGGSASASGMTIKARTVQDGAIAVPNFIVGFTSIFIGY